MAYGILKCDTVTFTDDGIDKSVSISGLVQNPTFSGNVTVTGTLSGVTVTGTTANFVSGVFSSQISGTTVTGTTASFTSGVFTNISGGTHTITSGVFAAGSNASPSISFTSDPDTGLYSPGANQVALSTNGTGRLFVDASGNVGVGAAPASGRSLHVQGAGFQEVVVEKTDASTSAILLAADSGLAGIYSRTTATDSTAIPLALFTGNTERLRITSTGTVNIVGAGTAGSTQAVSFNGSAPVNSLLLDASGRLLVGTSSLFANVYPFSTARTPSFQLVGNNEDKAHAFIVRTQNNGAAAGGYLTLGGGSVTYPVAINYTVGGVHFNGFDGTNYRSAANILCSIDGAPGADDMPGRLVFSTTADGEASPTERMRISANGDTFIISENNSFTASSSQGAGTSSYLFRGRYGGTLGTTNSGTVSFGVFTNGDTVNTNNSYGAISDIKLKENIVDANSQWADIKALQVRNYNFKEGQTHTQIGLIAQEVELVSPGLVSESPDRDADGNDLGTVTKSVNYSVLYMKAVKALQEAMERIETLEAKVAALESA